MRLSETIFRLKAIVTPADERHPPASEELRRFARERLTAYKVPRLIEVRASLPRSATGKILRHLLVESASA
jgi:acyl-CoA synthetase (AMP-forming)/AMP-acid ligase II